MAIRTELKIYIFYLYCSMISIFVMINIGLVFIILFLIYNPDLETNYVRLLIGIGFILLGCSMTIFFCLSIMYIRRSNKKKILSEEINKISNPKISRSDSFSSEDINSENSDSVILEDLDIKDKDVKISDE